MRWELFSRWQLLLRKNIFLCLGLSSEFRKTVLWQVFLSQPILLPKVWNSVQSYPGFQLGSRKPGRKGLHIAGMVSALEIIKESIGGCSRLCSQISVKFRFQILVQRDLCCLPELTYQVHGLHCCSASSCLALLAILTVCLFAVCMFPCIDAKPQIAEP